MSSYRVYFFDVSTKSEIDHPLSGKSWLATSGYVYRDGEFVRGTCVSLAVCDYSDLRHVKNEVRVTPDDFDGPVLVKIWGPNGRVDWRVLMREDGDLDRDAAAWCGARTTV